jgi:predicted nucleotide-binding protein (sugar kinase/HSP70/actin superfamily)
MLHLSETVMMNDLMGNLPKRKTENLEPVEAQTSKRSNRKFKRGYKRISSKMLHIQFSIEEDKNMVKIIVH